jgi:ABC-type dipeptide/oligopeptide/nickel transport system permease subunit
MNKLKVDNFKKQTITAPSPWQKALKKFFHQPAGIIGITILSIYIFISLFPTLIAPYSPLETFAGHELAAPNAQFILGTDPIGRDIFSRIIYAAPIALKVGFISVAIGITIGGLTGFAAAYLGGGMAKVIMRFWDGVFSMPAVLIGITLAAAIGSGLPAIAIAVGIAAAPSMARVANGAGLQQMGIGYIESANALGLPRIQIFFVHLLPNAMGPVLVQGALFMGVAVILEASLSFLGVGIQPPTPSWGSMLAESQQYLKDAWWYGVFPGIAIAGLVLSMNMIADAARDALDPKSR